MGGSWLGRGRRKTHLQNFILEPSGPEARARWMRPRRKTRRKTSFGFVARLGCRGARCKLQRRRAPGLSPPPFPTARCPPREPPPPRPLGGRRDLRTWELPTQTNDRTSPARDAGLREGGLADGSRRGIDELFRAAAPRAPGYREVGDRWRESSGTAPCSVCGQAVLERQLGTIFSSGGGSASNPWK